MKSDEIFRYTEKCLYNYHENLARLDVLKEDLRVLRCSSDVKAQSYQLTFFFTGEHSDPVARYVEKIERLEAQIKRLQRSTAPITKLIEDLKNLSNNVNSRIKEYEKVLELFYFGGVSLSEIAAELHRSRRTISARRHSLVMKAAGYLGL